MNNLQILYPVFALASWTSVVLLLIPLARVRAVRCREVVVDDFKYGESSSVPPRVSMPNRNYMNLLELPVLFYVACLLVYVTHGATVPIVYIAWAYVVLRIIHSVIHLTYNNVIHRLGAFALSNSVLVVLWVLAALQVSADAS